MDVESWLLLDTCGNTSDRCLRMGREAENGMLAVTCRGMYGTGNKLGEVIDERLEETEDDGCKGEGLSAAVVEVVVPR